MWIRINRQKTDANITIPLLPKAIEIMEKHKDHPACIGKDIVLPVRSNQKMNEYLKEIASLCEISELNTHKARRTFGSTVIIDRVSTFFSGFTISTKNPITSNKIELEYNSQKILELNYDKQKTRVDCHSDHYYIQNTTLNIVSQDYILEQQIIDYTNITYIIRLVNLDTIK